MLYDLVDCQICALNSWHKYAQGLVEWRYNECIIRLQR